MRWFRVPAFTGIQAAADDADRGTLRICEGCLPLGPGGLRSAPVWDAVGTADNLSSSSWNYLSGSDDGKGNSVVWASRFGEVHDVKVFSSANTDLVLLPAGYGVSVGSLYQQDKACMSAIGNRMVAFGDGSAEALSAGKGPPTAIVQIAPDNKIYHQEYSRFPNCKFYIQGPRKTLFASGNKNNPLKVYISEPAGLTQPHRDSLYSSEATGSVDLLMTDASEITALSSLGNNVAVHTDAGIFLLSPSNPDQASSGYRVEQAPTSVASAAVNLQVVAGEDGTQPYYLGFDGQIWKDPAGPGSEQKHTYADPVQASAKAKGRWDVDHPIDLSDSFSAYEPETGMYWVYMKTKEWEEYQSTLPPSVPGSISAVAAPGAPSTISAALPPQAPSGISALSSPGKPWLVSALAEPGAPSSISATVVGGTIVAPGAPSGISALAQPGAPSGISALAQPGAPSSISAVLATQAPGAPSNISALAEPGAPSAISALAEPGAPSNISAVHQVQVPGAPSSISALAEPGAPSAISATFQCDAANPCDVTASNPATVNVNLTWLTVSATGTLIWQGNNPFGATWGHGGWEGTLNINTGGTHSCILEPVPQVGQQTLLKISFATGGGGVAWKTLVKDWSGVPNNCAALRCKPYGTYTLTEFNINYVAIVS